MTADPHLNEHAKPARESARLSQGEFIALLGFLMGTVAFSIDAMLPALPQIAQELSPDAPNRVQLIITSFMLGLGIGTLITGILSDGLGRKTVILGGVVVYCAGAALAWQADTLEVVLVGRLIQGLGASASRVVALAMVRDLYQGSAMARIMSFAMVVFTLVPAIAPTIGALIIWNFGWRGIFLAFFAFNMASATWLLLRQPETLPPEKRTPIRPSSVVEAARELFGSRTVMRAVAAQTFIMSMILSTLSIIQPLYDLTYGQGSNFPMLFAAIALFSSTASLLNARLVVRVPMRRIVQTVLLLQLTLSAVMLLAWFAHLPVKIEFAFVFLWTTGVFFTAGMSMGNLNAIAMEPMGHIAGKASSLLAAISTIGAVIIAVPVGLLFNGTPVPAAACFMVFAGLAAYFARP